LFIIIGRGSISSYAAIIIEISKKPFIGGFLLG